MSDSDQKGIQHPDLNTEEVERFSIARPCRDGRNGHPKCPHGFLMLGEAIDKLVQCTISRDSDNGIVIVQRDL